MENVGSIKDIQNLFKETITKFMENGLEAELDTGYGTDDLCGDYFYWNPYGL